MIVPVVRGIKNPKAIGDLLENGFGAISALEEGSYGKGTFLGITNEKGFTSPLLLSTPY